MNKKTEKKIEKLKNELKEAALEIADDMDILHVNDDTLTVIIRTELYDYFKEIDKKITDCYEKEIELEKLQEKFDFVK